MTRSTSAGTSARLASALNRLNVAGAIGNPSRST